MPGSRARAAGSNGSPQQANHEGTANVKQGIVLPTLVIATTRKMAAHTTTFNVKDTLDMRNLCMAIDHSNFLPDVKKKFPTYKEMDKPKCNPWRLQFNSSTAGAAKLAQRSCSPTGLRKSTYHNNYQLLSLHHNEEREDP